MSCDLVSLAVILSRVRLYIYYVEAKHSLHDLQSYYLDTFRRLRAPVGLPSVTASNDAPHLLARRSQYGYTTDPAFALVHEPEAVSASALAEITAASKRRERQRVLDEWRGRRLVVMREIEWLQSQRFQRDVRSTVRALQRQVDKLDVRLRAG